MKGHFRGWQWPLSPPERGISGARERHLRGGGGGGAGGGRRGMNTCNAWGRVGRSARSPQRRFLLLHSFHLSSSFFFFFPFAFIFLWVFFSTFLFLFHCGCCCCCCCCCCCVELGAPFEFHCLNPKYQQEKKNSIHNFIQFHLEIGLFVRDREHRTGYHTK